MAVKGSKRENKEFVKELFVGFTTVKVIAVNPSRAEVNALIEKEDTDDDKEINYAGSDDEGNDRLRLAFWLQDIKTGKKFVHSFNLTNKERKNKDATKVQLINSTCSTTWAPYVLDGDEVTAEVNESVIQPWFSNFIDRDKNILGKKKFRKALAGEEELGTLLRAWLGRMNFQDPDTEVMVDTKKLFKGNLKELRELISLDEDGNFTDEGFDTPFVVLVGVRTDKDDDTKKYQQVWNKSFLPNGFMKYINNGNKFPTDYTKKTWNKFKEEVEGEYGFDGFTKLVALEVYNQAEDIAGGARVGEEVPEPTDSSY